MKNKGDMKSIKFFTDTVKAEMPFLRVEEGMFKGVIFLLDTGSTDNIIFGNAYEQAKHLLHPVEGEIRLFGIEGNRKIVSMVGGVVSFCKKDYNMTFILLETAASPELSQEMGFPIAGIIGTNFMTEHNWVLDFGKQEVQIPSIDISVADLKKIRKES